MTLKIEELGNSAKIQKETRGTTKNHGTKNVRNKGTKLKIFCLKQSGNKPIMLS